MIIHSAHIGRLISDKSPYLLYDPKKDKQGRPERVIEKVKLDVTPSEHSVKAGPKESLIKLEPVDDDGIDHHASISSYSEGPPSVPVLAPESRPVPAKVAPTSQSQLSGSQSGDAQSQKIVSSGTPHIVPLSVSPSEPSQPATLNPAQLQSQSQAKSQSKPQPQLQAKSPAQPQSQPTQLRLDKNDGFASSNVPKKSCKSQSFYLCHFDSNHHIVFNEILDSIISSSSTTKSMYQSI